MSNSKMNFRAYDTEAKVIVATDFAIFGETTMFGAIDEYLFQTLKEGETSLGNLQRIVIVQCTGLVDSKGIRIYEGDIIRYSRPEASYIKEWVAEVCYNARNASFGIRGGNTFVEGLIESFSAWDEPEYDLLPFIEVIGNIFQNTELIANGKPKDI